MRLLGRVILYAVAAIGFASVAFAADIPVKAPPVAPVLAPAYSWTGFYVEVNVGGGWSNSNVGYSPNDAVGVRTVA